MSYHCPENSYMITKAVQIRLQAPKWRPSSPLAEVAENCPKSAMGSAWVGGGGEEIDAAGLPYHIYWRRVWGGEGEGREKREQIRPCTKCSLHACSFTLCLSFSYLRSAVAASFDIKKFHRNATDTYSKGKVYCFPKAMIKAFLREKNLKCPVFIYNQSTHVQYN